MRGTLASPGSHAPDAREHDEPRADGAAQPDPIELPTAPRAADRGRYRASFMVLCELDEPVRGLERVER